MSLEFEHRSRSYNVAIGGVTLRATTIGATLDARDSKNLLGDHPDYKSLRFKLKIVDTIGCHTKGEYELSMRDGFMIIDVGGEEYMPSFGFTDSWDGDRVTINLVMYGRNYYRDIIPPMKVSFVREYDSYYDIIIIEMILSALS